MYTNAYFSYKFYGIRSMFGSRIMLEQYLKPIKNEVRSGEDVSLDVIDMISIQKKKMLKKMKQLLLF